MVKSIISGILLLLLLVSVFMLVFDIKPVETEPQKHPRGEVLNMMYQTTGAVDDYIWVASFGPDNLYHNGLPGRYVGTDDPYNGFGVPGWTGNFSLTEPFNSVNSITVAALPFTPDEYNYILTEGIDYLVHAEDSLIELLTPTDVSIINEHWVEGVNSSLYGWPWIYYVASGIESVYVDMHNGTASPSPNAGYTGDYTVGEWWFDPDWTWELEGWWALGYYLGPWNWPAGSEWWVNYTAASYLTVNYASDPEPYITDPLDGSLVYGNMTEVSAVELNLAPNIVSATFEYRQGDIGPWILISVDSNSTDGWGTSWNLTDLSEEDYYVRVTMENSVGQVGEDLVHAYFDPTPPIPEFYELSYGDIVKGLTTLEVTTIDEDIDHVTFFYYDASEKEKPIPELSQAKVPAMGCGATAAATCLAYWRNYEEDGKKPYEGLYDGTDQGLIDMANDLYKLSETNSDTGVSGDKLETGIKTYIKNQGLEGKLVPKFIQNGDWKKAKEEFMACQDVLLLVKRPDGTKHWITLAGIEKDLEDTLVDFMDPSSGTVAGGILKNGKIQMDWNNDGEMKDDEVAEILDILTVCPGDQKKCPKDPLIGTDYNGVDGWSVVWDTNQLVDGYYFVKVVMTDATGNTETNIILVYVKNGLVIGIVSSRRPRHT